MLEQYKLGLLERTLMKWQMRALDSKLQKIMNLIPVFVRIGCSEDMERCIQNTRKIIFSKIKSRLMATVAFRWVMYKTKKYFDNEESFDEAKQRAYEIVTQNIQMFALVLEILDGIDRELERSTMIVKKNYEESFEISTQTKRLLDYQEKRYFADNGEL